MSGSRKIEVVSMKKLDNGKIKAFADLMLEKSYIVRGFRVVEGNEGLFVGFPQQNGKNGKWYDVFLDANEEIRSEISESVLASYQE